MTRTTLLLLAAALAAPLAWAQTPESRQRIEVAGTAVPLPDAATLAAMTGDFALSDGRRLQVSRPGLHLMVAVGKRWAVALEPVGPDRFASRDGRLQLRFDPGYDSLTLVDQHSVSVASRGGAGTVQ